MSTVLATESNGEARGLPLRPQFMIRRALFVVACAAVAGCNGGSTSPPPFFTGTAAPTATPTPTPTPTPMPQHLYIGNGDLNYPPEIHQYNLPATNGVQGPVPSLYLFPPVPTVIGLALDAAGSLAVGGEDGTLLFYNAPVTNGEAPAAKFPNGSRGDTQIAFTPAGDFFVGAGNRVNMFTHPFSNAGTPSSSITNPALSLVSGVVLDAAQNLYIVNRGNGTGGNLFVYAPPYSGAPTVTAIVPGTFYAGAAISATQLFVTSPGQSARVDVYNLPITAASVPAFSIAGGFEDVECAAVDAAGNLYLGDRGNSTVIVMAPPFSAKGGSRTDYLLVHTASPSLPNKQAYFRILSIAVGK